MLKKFAPLKIVAELSGGGGGGCFEPASNPSQFSFCESESTRNVRQLCEGLATCETKL